MNEPLRDLWELLELERSAARHADVHALMDLQERKRTAMAGLQEHGVGAQDRDALARRAAANIELIRHLIAMLGVAAGIHTSTYGKQGLAQRDANPPPLRSRG